MVCVAVLPGVVVLAWSGCQELLNREECWSQWYHSHCTIVIVIVIAVSLLVSASALIAVSLLVSVSALTLITNLALP